MTHLAQRRQPRKADTLAGFLVRRGEGRDLPPGTAAGLIFVLTESWLIHWRETERRSRSGVACVISPIYWPRSGVDYVLGGDDSRSALVVGEEASARIASRNGSSSARVAAGSSRYGSSGVRGQVPGDHPGGLLELKELMGHRNLANTQIYLRRLDRQRSMETVRPLSWGARFSAIAEKATSGFEPLYEALQASA